MKLQEISRIAHWSHLYRLNTKLNKSLDPAKPLEKDNKLSGSSGKFYLFDFFPQNNFSSFFPWPSQRYCYCEHQLSTQIVLTNGEHVTHRWYFPPWPSSELVCSSTVGALMDAVKSCDEEENKLTVQTFPLNFLFFNVPTCSVPSRLPITGMLSHTEPRKTKSTITLLSSKVQSELSVCVSVSQLCEF